MKPDRFTPQLHTPGKVIFLTGIAYLWTGGVVRGKLHINPGELRFIGDDGNNIDLKGIEEFVPDGEQKSNGA
jgi:hypothetical protein